MRSFAHLGAALVLVLSVLTPPSGHAQELSSAEAALLPDMDSKVIREVLELAGKLEGWRKDIARLHKSLDKASKASSDPKAAADAAEAVLEITRRLQTCSPFLRRQIGFEEKIAPLLKRLTGAGKDLPNLSRADLRALVRSQAQRAVTKQIATVLEQGVLDRIRALHNPAQLADSFIENRLKKEYFNKPYPFAGLTFRIAQKDFSTSVFSARADIAILVTHADSGAQVKAHGLYFKYKHPLPEPVTSKLTFETPGAEDVLALVRKYLPPVGPISLDRDVPVTVTPDRQGNGKTTHLGILVDFSQLEEVGLGKLKMKAKVVLDSRGKVAIDGASLKMPLTPPVVLGNTSLLITSVTLGLPARNEVRLGLTLSTVAGEENTLSAEIGADVRFPVLREGIALDGRLWLNKAPLAHVRGFLNKDRLTLSMDSDAITGGTGKLTVKGTLTRQGFDASAQFDALLGLANASGQLHLGSDGHGSLSVSSQAMLGVTRVDASMAGSFTPGFKNLTFRGALSVDIPDDYLGLVTAEVDFSGRLLPSPRLTASGHVGPVTLPRVEVANFNQLVKELKKALLREREQFYKFLADTESKASKYADQRTQVFAGWVYQNARNIGLDKVATGNPTVDKALGDISRGAKSAGGTLSQGGKDLGKGASDEYHHILDVGSNAHIPGLSLTGGSPLRSATLSAGASGGFGLHGDSAFKDMNAQLTRAIQKAERQAALSAQLAPVTKSLDQVVIQRHKPGHVGQIAGLRMRTSRVLTHVNGEHDVDVTLLVQVTSFRYMIDRKKGLVGRVAHTSNLYVADVALHGLAGTGRRPTAEVTFPALANVAPYDAAALLREELLRRIDARLGDVQLTDHFEERRLYLHNLTDEPITAHVQVETRVGSSWRWQPAGPGSTLKSFQVAVPAHKIVPVHVGERGIAQGRRARIWASSASGRVWAPYASRDVLLVPEKDDEGQARYPGRSLQNFRFWFAAPSSKTTVFHERLVSVRNNTRAAVLVTAEVAVRDSRGSLEWERAGQPTLVPPESTLALRHTHSLPMRGAAVRFRAEDDKKQLYRWVHAWKAPVAGVDVKGYSAPAIGTTLLVLEAPGARPSSTNSPDVRDVTLHFPADQVLLPVVKGMPLHRARQLLEEKGFRVISASSKADGPVLSQSPEAGWEPFGTSVRLSTPSAPEETVLVPGLVGKSLAEAESAARPHLVVRARNVERVTTRPTRDRALLGKTLIERQEPAAGSRVRPRSVVEVLLVRYVPERGPAPPHRK